VITIYTMGLILKLVLAIITVFIAYQISKLYETPPIPNLEDTWWGPRDSSKEDTSIQPFKIDVSDTVSINNRPGNNYFVPVRTRHAVSQSIGQGQIFINTRY
jgi:hypothetical protein